MASAGSDKTAAGTWRTAGALALALLATAAVVAAIISQVAARSAELAFGAEGSYLVTEGSASGAKRLAGSLPGSLVEDSNGTVWSIQSVDVEIFHDSYLSPDGKAVTVQSADGSKVVAPGTEGSYEFSARNATDVPATYDLRAETVLSAPTTALPIEGRMKSGDSWLVGGEAEWVPIGQMREIEDNVALGGHQAKSYRFEWRWPFERDGAAGDAEDMELDGLEGGSTEGLDLSVRLQATASYDSDFLDDGAGSDSDDEPDADSDDSSPSARSQAPSASPSPATSPRFGAAGFPGTGDPVRAVPVAVAMVAAALLALVSALMLRRRRGDGPGGGAGDER